jgi:serine protease Do
MLRPRLSVLLGLAGVAALRCASSPVYPSATIKTAEHRKAIDAEPAKASPVEFRKFLLKLPEDGVIGSVQFGGGCTGRAPLRWKTGRDGSAARDFGALLLDELSAAGYPIAGDRDELFDDPHDRRAEYAIAGVIHDVRANVCYAKPGRGRATAEASLSIDWQIYSHRTRSVEMRTTTDGSIRLARPREEPGADALAGAFVSAARNLMAEARFHDLVVGAAAEAQGTPKAPISIAYDTPSASPRRDAESVVADSRMAVVTVFAGDAMGSGFLISRDGYLLTDEHVVGTTRYVRVKFVTGREVNGDVVRADRRRDVALVKLENDVYPYLPLGQSSRVRPGADVFAIGTPIEERFGQTVTKGVLSGFGEDDGLRILRSDVSIQRGNSGGPLLDRTGAVVGLSVNAYTLPEGVGIGLNGFIPIEEALEALTIERR